MKNCSNAIAKKVIITPAPNTKEKITVSTTGQPDLVALLGSMFGLNSASHFSSARKP